MLGFLPWDSLKFDFEGKREGKASKGPLGNPTVTRKESILRTRSTSLVSKDI